MDTKLFFIIFALLIQLVIGEVKILDLKVPSTVESGSSDELILDCDYEVNDEIGLVIKWYHQKENLVYQWIPPNKPQAWGLLKDRIDVNYKASNNNNTMYRALRIKDINRDLSGEYTCLVSGLNSEAMEAKKMTVYEPPKAFELVHVQEGHSVICSAFGVYPEAKLKVYILGLNKNATMLDIPDEEEDEDGDENDNGIPDEQEEVLESTEDLDIIEESEDKSYNITSILNYRDGQLSEFAVFVCDLWIPDTTYRQTQKLSYYLDNGAIGFTANSFVLVSAIILTTTYRFF